MKISQVNIILQKINIINNQTQDSNISNTRSSVSSEYPNTEKRVENTMHIGVFCDRTQVVWVAVVVKN